MDTDMALELLKTEAEKKPSEVGKAIDVLFHDFGSYAAIEKRFGKSSYFWRQHHRVYGLPKGIQSKVDKGEINLGECYEISRLKDEEDQWLLAVAIIEAEDFTIDECNKVVNGVLNSDNPLSIKESLKTYTGFEFGKTQPLVLVPFPFDVWFQICKRAWSHEKELADICYQLICQGIAVDINEVADQLEKLASDLRRTNRTKRDDQSKEVIDE